MSNHALYIILGYPVHHSRSPAMHNAAFAALELPATYVACPVRPGDLPAAIAGIRALHVAGANVTLPHKAAVMDHLDELSPQARAIGAVNTIVREGDRLVGHNTDAAGLVRALQEDGLVVSGLRVTVLGAGGAARAAVVGLVEAGASAITVAARRPEAAVALVDGLRAAMTHTDCALACAPLDDLGSHLAHTELLVQATSATLEGAPAAQAFADSLPLSQLPDGAVVTDLVYKPLHTSLLQRARARGLRTIDGLGMLLHQGALSFEHWTGRSAPIPVMRRVLLESPDR